MEGEKNSWHEPKLGPEETHEVPFGELESVALDIKNQGIIVKQRPFVREEGEFGHVVKDGEEVITIEANSDELLLIGIGKIKGDDWGIIIKKAKLIEKGYYGPDKK